MTESIDDGTHTWQSLDSLGSDLMRGYGERVVSAWKHIRELGLDGLDHARLFERVVSDVGRYRAGDRGQEYSSAAWVCRPYLDLARSYGVEDWPLRALRSYLPPFFDEHDRKGLDAVADRVWQAELLRYMYR